MLKTSTSNPAGSRTPAPHTAIVSAEWLAEVLAKQSDAQSNSARVIVLHVVMQPVGAAATTSAPPAYIPGAILFDLDRTFSDTNSPLPHTLLSADEFTARARQLGIDQDSTIVVYDTAGIYSAARAWWMFKLMGHAEVYVLDGGMPRWQQLGLQTVAQPAAPKRAGNFSAQFAAAQVVDYAAVQTALQSPTACVIDARSRGRFAGTEPEPRAGLRSGHMPGAINIPFTECLRDGCLLPQQVLQTLFQAARITSNQQLIFTCGSGVTACVPLLAAYQCGFEQLFLYDGSWCEWASRDGLPN